MIFTMVEARGLRRVGQFLWLGWLKKGWDRGVQGGTLLVLHYWSSSTSVHFICSHNRVALLLCIMTTESNNVSCTISRYTLPCDVCSADIRPGDRMFCSSMQAQEDITSDNNKTTRTNKTLLWGHEACYNSNLPPPPPCRHWQRRTFILLCMSWWYVWSHVSKDIMMRLFATTNTYNYFILLIITQLDDVLQRKWDCVPFNTRKTRKVHRYH